VREKHVVRQSEVGQIESTAKTAEVTLPETRSALNVRALFRAMRPLQWTKNALVFAGLVFARSVFDLEPFLTTVAAAIIFCAVSSGTYLINDIRDVEQDRHHPRKRFRPIASGEVTVRQAAITASILIAGGLIASLLIRPAFAAVIGGYLVLMTAYSYGLKRLVILDVFAIAAGFVLRAAGGAVAIAVPISPWLYVCTMLLALFVGFGKRRSEIVLLEAQAGRHRANLDAYTIPMLDQILGIVSSATVMAYSLYTFDAASVPDNKSMMLTIPFVLYAIFRYLYLIHRHDLGGSPEVLLFADRPLLLCIVGWGLTSVVILALS
jgi:4-hydroxybenzoate polyprenyltransferase